MRPKRRSQGELAALKKSVAPMVSQTVLVRVFLTGQGHRIPLCIRSSPTSPQSGGTETDGTGLTWGPPAAKGRSQDLTLGPISFLEATHPG